jgi:sortase family protein
VRDSVRRLVGALAIGAGLGLLAVAVVGWQAERPVPRAFGVTRADPPALAVETPTRSARLASAVGPPVTLTIPSQQVRAEVLPVADVGGILQVPDDPARLGWWNAGAPVGASRGTVVIDGHVDSAASGPGALFRLAELRTADRIVLSTASGSTRSYLVTGRRVYRKTAGLPSDIFDQLGPPRLVLISCGGPFDSAAGSYLDNIVVFAAPA